MENIKNTIDFEVAEQALIYDHNGSFQTNEDYKLIQRTDNGKILNVVKSGYEPYYNRDFVETVERMKEISHFEFKGYNILKDGGIILAHLKNTDDNLYIGDSKINDYLLLGNSHDGSMPFFFGTTTEVVWCTNQFSKIEKAERVRHTKSSPKRIDELLRQLEIYFKNKEQLIENFKIFNDIRVKEDTAKLAVEAVLGITEEMKEKGLSTRIKNKKSMIETRVESEMKRLGDNLWGLFNGFTYYTSNDLENKDYGFGLIRGQAAAINNRAYGFVNRKAQELITI